MSNLGIYIRKRREKLLVESKSYSLRQVATRIRIEPSYLSKVERGEAAPLSEVKIIALARELDVDPDVLLALSGKVASDVLDIIKKRPKTFTLLIRKLKRVPDKTLHRIIRSLQTR
jgi:transcriptional regulator with XRE-family HTH domain